MQKPNTIDDVIQASAFAFIVAVIVIALTAIAHPMPWSPIGQARLHGQGIESPRPQVDLPPLPFSPSTPSSTTTTSGGTAA